MAKILVIDDCPEFLEVITDALEDLGHTVIVASDPETGEQLCDDAVELVLCDLVMPLNSEESDDEFLDDSAMVGVHTISAIHKRRPELPVVVISGQMDGQPLRAIQSFGAVDSLAKPFAREDLERVINGALLRADHLST